MTQDKLRWKTFGLVCLCLAVLIAMAILMTSCAGPQTTDDAGYWTPKARGTVTGAVDDSGSFDAALHGRLTYGPFFTAADIGIASQPDEDVRVTVDVLIRYAMALSAEVSIRWYTKAGTAELCVIPLSNEALKFCFDLGEEEITVVKPPGKAKVKR